VNEFELRIRNIQEADYAYVIERINAWWGGRNMADMLPRLFFVHFQDSSFVGLDGDRIIGFLVGFISNVNEDTGYVHFAGVDPAFRRANVARSLYARFFDYCRERGAKVVKCVTSPVNTASLAFHQRLGFRAAACDSHGNPLPVRDYDGPGEHRVVFVLRLDP
jgi:ribosomal protein S18 acetylase RimI-like enzyme